MQNRQPPYLLNSSNFYPIGPNLPAQNIPLPVLVTHPLMYANAQQGASLDGGLQQRLAQVNQTLALANQEIKQTEKRLDFFTNTNRDNLYTLWILRNSRIIVDPKSYVGCEYMITKIMFNNITAQDYACVLKDTSIIVNNLGDYLPHQLELLSKREYYERSFAPRFNVTLNTAHQRNWVIVNDYFPPQIAEVDNSERIYYVEVEQKNSRKKMKQLVDSKSYEGDQSDIKSISMEELKSKRWYIISKNTRMKVTNVKEYNLEELRIIGESTFNYYRRIQKAQEDEDNSELIYYVKVEEGRKNIKQIVDPKSYVGDQNHIKSIPMKMLKGKRLCIVSKNTYTKVTNLQEHNLEELMIMAERVFVRQSSIKKIQEGEDNSERIYYMEVEEGGKIIKQLVDPKNEGDQSDIKSISMEELKSRRWHIISKNTRMKVANVKEHNLQELRIVGESTFTNYSNIKKAQEGEDNSERIYYVEVGEGRKIIKQLVDPKSYVGDQNHIKSISMKMLRGKQLCIVSKNTYTKITNLQEHNLEELMIIAESVFVRQSSIKKIQEGEGNFERIYYVEMKKKGDRNKIKQLVDPKNYEGDQNHIKSISMKMLKGKRLCIVSKNTYTKVTNLQEHNLQELIIVSDCTFNRHSIKKAQKGEDNSERIYYVEVEEGGKIIKQLVDPKQYKGDPNDIKSISMKMLKSNQWYVVLKDTYTKVTNVKEHELQELRIIPGSTFANYSKQKKAQESQSNVDTSTQQKETTEKTVKKKKGVKRKATPLTSPPAKKQKTISNNPPKEPEATTTATNVNNAANTTIATNVNHATNPYAFFRSNTKTNTQTNTQTVPRAIPIRVCLKKPTVTPPIPEPVTIAQKPAEEVVEVEGEQLRPVMKFDREEMTEVLKILRGDSKGNACCTRYAEGVVKYLATGIMPQGPVDDSDSTYDHFGVYRDKEKIRVPLVKVEGERQPKKDRTNITVYSSIIDRKTTLGILARPNERYPEEEITITNPRTGKRITSAQIDLGGTRTTDFNYGSQQSIHFAQLNEALKWEAIKDPSGRSFGIVSLGRSGEHVDVVGHVVAYGVYPDENGELMVYFMEPPTWNKTGEWIFSDIAKGYDFLQRPRQKRTRDTFGHIAFYMPMNGRHCQPEKREEKERAEPIAPRFYA